MRVLCAGMGRKNIITTLQGTVTVLPGQGLGFHAKKGAELPSHIKVLNWGDNPNANGKPVKVGKKLMAALAAATYAYRQVALDYEHGTLPGSAEYKKTKEPRQVAGFGGVEVREGDGVYLNVDYYTPSGTENAHNYCDVSAGVYLDDEGEVLAVHSVALCRNGAVEGMKFEEVALSVTVPCAAPEPTEDNNMDWEKIRKRLGLPEGATEAQIKAAYEKWLAENPEPAAKPGEDGKPPEDGKSKPGEKKPAALNTDEPQNAPQALSVDAVVDQLEKRQLLKEAATAGKVVALSAEALAAMKPADLEVYIAGLSATVPVDQRTPKSLKDKPTGDTPTGLSAVEATVFERCGVQPEEPKKA